MSSPAEALVLAPAGVLRAAAWPLEALADFGDAELAARARGGAAFERAYEAAVRREAEALWTRSIDDPRFERALLLASPSAHARARSAAGRRDAARNRARRLSEYTLYRYLARAAGRSTPNGLWAGVAALRFGSAGAVAAAPALRFAPDLRPFQALVAGLARRPAYRDRAAWCLNPSLGPDPAGGWLFHARCDDGRLERRALARNVLLAPILATLDGLAPAPLGELAAELARRGCWPVGARRHLLATLAELAGGGVLVGGLQLPLAFASPQQALAEAAEALLPADRVAWTAAADALAAHCAALSGAGEGPAPAQLAARLEAAAACLDGLAGALELAPVARPGQLLACDLRLPWRVELDAAAAAGLRAALGDYQRQWIGGLSPAAAQRELERARLAARLGDGLPLAQAIAVLAEASGDGPWPPPAAAEAPQLSERLAAWEACLAAAGPQAILTDAASRGGGAGAPLGCLFAGLGEGRELAVHSVADIPDLASRRLAGLVEDGGTTAWLRLRLTRHGAAAGVALAQLRAPFEANPNVLAGEPLVDEFVAPWSAAAGARALAGAQLAAGGGQPRLWLAGDARPWEVLAGGAANLHAGDALARLLLVTGHHESPGRNQRAVMVPSAQEMAAERLAPRLRLAGGAVLRPRRAVIAASLAALRASHGAERFRLWQGLARRLDWPDWLQVSADGGEPLRMNRDSPLALEALFKGLGPGTAYLSVEEAASHGLAVPGGGRHLAELALPFSRRG